MSSTTDLLRAPVERRIEAVAATTHVTDHNTKLTRGALEGMAEAINRSGLPSYLEHDRTRPPVGRTSRAWIEQLGDGEWACHVEMEVFHGLPAFTVAGEPPVLAPAPPPVEPELGLLGLNADPTNYRRPELLQRAAEAARRAGPVEADTTLVRQSALPDPYLIVLLGSAACAAGWFAQSFFTKMAEPLAGEVGEDLAPSCLAEVRPSNFTRTSTLRRTSGGSPTASRRVPVHSCSVAC